MMVAAMAGETPSVRVEPYSPQSRTATLIEAPARPSARPPASPPAFTRSSGGLCCKPLTTPSLDQQRLNHRMYLLVSPLASACLCIC